MIDENNDAMQILPFFSTLCITNIPTNWASQRNLVYIKYGKCNFLAGKNGRKVNSINASSCICIIYVYELPIDKCVCLLFIYQRNWFIIFPHTTTRPFIIIIIYVNTHTQLKHITECTHPHSFFFSLLLLLSSSAEL